MNDGMKGSGHDREMEKGNQIGVEGSTDKPDQLDMWGLWKAIYLMQF